MNKALIDVITGRNTTKKGLAGMSADIGERCVEFEHYFLDRTRNDYRINVVVVQFFHEVEPHLRQGLGVAFCNAVIPFATT